LFVWNIVSTSEPSYVFFFVFFLWPYARLHPQLIQTRCFCKI
jgi:hypothetical protein